LNSEIIIIIPFAILLISIAVFPIVAPKFWHKHYPKVSFALGFIVLNYYLIISPNINKLLHTVEEYLSFIVLLFSLFLVSGGIFIKLKGRATPIRNVLLLAVGAVIANLFGTTGASMILIRPMLASNKYRIKSYHIIFFIFIIGNIGGSMTPIGDPPLLLGFLRGVPFFWVTTHLIYVWLFAISLLLIIFYAIDKYYYEKVKEDIQLEIEAKKETIKIEGIINLIPLLIIIGAVFIQRPLFLREIIMIIAALSSYKFTPKQIHEKNHFNFEPIKEVAILFAGIFITMIPALEYISIHSKEFGLASLTNLFWFTGLLTGFLDNAPTYLNFLSGSMGLFNLSSNTKADVLKFAMEYPIYLKVVSVASVFFGAMTYIGNAPNFMIKTIAEHKGIKMPGFFAYMYKYSLIILIPIFILVWLIFYYN